MKKGIYLLVVISLFFIELQAFGQSDCFPINDYTGLIEIKGKVVAEDNTRDEILNKLVVWGVSKHTSPVGQDIFKDEDSGVFKIHLAINYNYKDGFRTMYYAITMIAKDGYFEYTVNDFIMNEKPMKEYLFEKAEDKVYQQSFGNICKKMNYTLNSLKALQ